MTTNSTILITESRSHVSCLVPLCGLQRQCDKGHGSDLYRIRMTKVAVLIYNGIKRIRMTKVAVLIFTGSG
jgi:hypothetical protein